MAIAIRGVSAEQTRAFHVAMGNPFGFDPTEQQTERMLRCFEVDRLRAAFDGDQIVGTFGAHSLDLTLPGGRLPASGVTVVTVLPTHRRQGVLRTMMADHLREIHEKGDEPLAALWASEADIYGRFGFAPAVQGLFETKIEKPKARLRETVDLAGTMRWIDADEAAERLPPVYDAVRRERPGMFARPDTWWRDRLLDDPESNREGHSALRTVVHTRDGRDVGYVQYRTKVGMDDDVKAVVVRELVAVDPEAERAAWQFVFGIDLSTVVKGFNLPVDCPLPWWLEDSRGVNLKVEDSLWLRLVDVPRALAARRYRTEGAVVIGVRDAFCPWNEGTYRLAATADGTATCDRVEQRPEIETDVNGLATVYLAGHRVGDLARAGRFRGEAAAIDRADRMFDWSRRPWCQEVF